MEEQFNFDLNFDFLDAPTSIAKPIATVSTNYARTADPQVLDVQSLASKIASVNDLVLQLKNEREEHAKLQKQMQSLSESAMSIRRLYEQEKAEKAKYALLSQEFKEKYEVVESQLANKTLQFEQLSSKIEQAEEKGPIPYNELILRYHRLALYLDEDNDLNHKEKQKLQQIQEYMVAKKLSTLTSFKKKRKQQPVLVKKDQGVQHYPEMISKSTCTEFEVMQKKFVSQGTQHTSYTTTRGTSTENHNTRKEVKTQGTQYISSTTTRSTSTSGFIKTHSVGTNFPAESTKLVDDIFSEMIFDIVPLSPLAEEDITPVEQVETKTVGTITGLKNVRKAIDYVTPVSIKSSDSRPPSRNMFERVKNEVPFMGAQNMNTYGELGANSSSVPNNITDLWNLLGHTFFSLLQNVNTFNNPVNLNVINDRIRNANINVSSDGDQQRNSESGSNFGKAYFEDPRRNCDSPRGFLCTTRSTATSPIAELENPSQSQQFSSGVCAAEQPPTSCPNVSTPNNTRGINHVNSSPPVEIQKIVLNKVFHGESVAGDHPSIAEQSKEGLNYAYPMPMKRKSVNKAKKTCKCCRKAKRLAAGEQNSALEFPDDSRNKSIPPCAVEAQFSNASATENHPEESGSVSPTTPPLRETSLSTSLEDELFGLSDEEDANLNGSLPVGNQVAPDYNVFCKPFMPKKRKKQDTLDTRIFHMGELKGNVSEKMPSHPKRKRSMKSINEFSKVRICSQSSFDSSSLSSGISSTQQRQMSVKVVRGCSPIESALSATDSTCGDSDVPTPSPLSFSVSSLPQPQPLVRETTTPQNRFSEYSLDLPVGIEPPARDSSDMPDCLSFNAQAETDTRNKTVLSEDDNVSTKPAQAQSEELSVIDVSSPTPQTSNCDQALSPDVYSAETSMKKGSQRIDLNIGNNIRKTKEGISIGCPPERNSEIEVANAFIPGETNCSEWAVPANQTANSNSYLDKSSSDDSNERLEELLHRISDEFSTPERPVSAIPPCDSSQTDDSFSEEEPNAVKAPDPVKGKSKKRKPCLTVTAVKRSERLKAKNCIQEAMKYTQLKIPPIELGKYTKRKTDAKTTAENSCPSPPRVENPKPASKDPFNDELARAQETPPEQIRITTSLQNSTSDSEENTSNELVIDLQDEATTIQRPCEDNSCPDESKNDYASPEVSQAEASGSSDELSDALQLAEFDESPSSPSPIDRGSETDHIPAQIPERANRKPKSNSLLSQIIANYNHECHKKVQESRQEQDKVIGKQVQATLAAFVHTSGDSEDIMRVVENICNITNCEQLIAHGLISEVKTAPRPEKESNSPVPELYLGQTLRRVLQLLDPLYAKIPNLKTALLKNIEKAIFSFTKDFIPLDMTLNLTQFYLAVVADASAPSNPARLFICKCLFFYTKKAIPMIYEALCVYPSVLPHRDDTAYDRSDALISTIQCVLMSTFYDIEKCDLKAKQMLHKLRSFYNYESLKPSREEVVENLVAKLRAGRFKNVSYSFALICKRMEMKYILKSILGERLLPLANEYYQTISETAENDERIACVLECISYVIKPFPVDSDITTYINLYSRFLNAVDRQVVQEAAVSAILRTIRFGYVQCFTAIYNFQPKYEISEEFKVMLRSFVYKKNLGYLRKLESQIHVLTQ